MKKDKEYENKVVKPEFIDEPIKHLEPEIKLSEVKSELKIIEAGMKKKALIAQDFGIYKELLKDGETGILIKDNKDGWYKAMKKVIQDPEYRQMLADNLHNFVKDKYDLKNVTTQRAEIYKSLVKEKAKKKAELTA